MHAFRNMARGAEATNECPPDGHEELFATENANETG
jgi:hypothetical protein